MKNRILFCGLFFSVFIFSIFFSNSRGLAIDHASPPLTNPEARSIPNLWAWVLPEDEEINPEAEARMMDQMMANYGNWDNRAREQMAVNLQSGNWDQALNQLENTWEQDMQTFYGENAPEREVSLQKLQQTLGGLDQETGQKSAIVYLASRPNSLEVLLVTADAPPARHSIAEAKRDVLFKTAGQLLLRIDNKERTTGRAFLTPARQLYRWIINPLIPQLDRQQINNLIFVTDYGLRSIPMAVLHDGQQFLIEKYSIANSPSFSMINPRFKSLKESPVLAMGASTFINQEPLPAVPVELRMVTQDRGRGQSFLNQPFTVNNLISQRQRQPFEIVHLATHAGFNDGSPDRSYIQFFDSQLLLNDLGKLGLNDPPVSLLVISACQSAMGNRNAELGFGGLALKSGVDTVVASLWYVSDEGTLALMSELYRYLRTAPIKAQALRQAQIAMLKGNIRIENGQLITQTNLGNDPANNSINNLANNSANNPANNLDNNSANNQTSIALPPELRNLSVQNLTHPYYWSSFVMLGSPW
jgi:CHAT domain-containing protein